MAASFSDEMDEKLIELVRIQPVLYNFKLDNYKNNASKERIWRSIGTELGRTGNQCKSRWRSIRDTYRKIKTKGKYTNCSASPSKSKYHSNKFAFLDVILQGRQTNISPMVEENESADCVQQIITRSEFIKEEVDIDENDKNIDEFHDEESEQNYSEGTIGHSDVFQENRKVRLENQDMEGNSIDIEDQCFVKKFEYKEESPIELFFKSMAKSVEQFSPDLVAETRLKICQIVTEMEIRHISRHKFPTSN